MITEIDLADGFVEQHKADLRFSCKQAQWFINTPEGWIRDDTNACPGSCPPALPQGLG